MQPTPFQHSNPTRKSSGSKKRSSLITQQQDGHLKRQWGLVISHFGEESDCNSSNSFVVTSPYFFIIVIYSVIYYSEITE